MSDKKIKISSESHKSQCPSCAIEKKPKESSLLGFQVVIVGVFLGLSWLAEFLNWRIDSLSLPWQNLANVFGGIVILIGWWPILNNALRVLRAKKINVNVLVSIAVTASLFIQAYKEAGTVIFIMLLGGFLEKITIKRTNRAIEKLLELTPRKAVIKKEGREIIVAYNKIQVGDIVIIKPGEMVPVDGRLLSKKALINQSIITGESKPIIKKQGERVLAGSISDGSYFEIEAVQVGDKTTLFRIQKLVREAKERKAPIQRTVDRFAQYFVPGVLAIAFVVGILTLDIKRAITILIVACPCAFVIATPIAVVAAIGRGARRGILIKGGEYLENLGRINIVIFDKTGTLTKGKPQVLEIKTFKNYNQKEVLEIAASLESKSEHYIAQAILEKAREFQIKIREFEKIQIVKGKGIVGRYQNQEVCLGNIFLIQKRGIKLPRFVVEYVQQEERKGHTVVIVACSGEICGVICVSDQLREKAGETILSLRHLGIREIWMMTGDNKQVASNIAKEIQVDKIFAQMLPEEKIYKIRELQQKGVKVIMVGDGINDTPALMEADVGIAMGSGTDIALESGSVVLMRDELKRIPEAISLGRRAVRVIKQNLIFAVIFNFIMFLLATGGLITMIGGALFHQISFLLVILNAMRLLK